MERWTRIAPTPSGRIHLGNLYSFLLTTVFAYQNNHKILLRIDDFDHRRAKPELVESLFNDLKALGLSWDQGPKNGEELKAEKSQQNFLEEYKRVCLNLLDRDKAFVCECSRKDIERTTQNGEYPGTCLKKDLEFKETKNSIRLKTQLSAVQNPNQLMDFYVIFRRDGLPAYQVVSLVEDMKAKINSIVRGTDLYDSTIAQLQLADLIGVDFQKTHFYQHDLILGGEGKKLSKSKSDAFLELKIESIYSELASWMGLSRPKSFAKIEDFLEIDLSKYLKLIDFG